MFRLICVWFVNEGLKQFFQRSYFFIYKGCPEIAVEGGHLSLKDTEHCSTVSVSCDPGSRLSGESAMICCDGEWNTEFPVCLKGVFFNLFFILSFQGGGSNVGFVSCFGVRFSVMFHFMFVHYTFSSVWVAEWPPFGK